MRTRSLEDVVNASLCTGCGICEAIAGHDSVRLQLNATGFYRPCVHQVSHEVWETISRVCPGVTVRQAHNADARGLERLWGPTLSARTGFSTDDQIRWQASSGGVLSALLTYLLETNRVDYVVHIGTLEEDPLSPLVCKSYTREQVLRNAGSRYAPTAPLITLADLLKEQARFAFVGKPCDVAALRAYGDVEPRVKQNVVVLLSFFCAGVPSMLATYDLITRLGVDRPQMRSFRYRGFGWPGRATAMGEDGHEHSMSYSESWGQILGPHVQFRCKICPDGVGEMADVVCGDAWHLEDGQPSFAERPGESIILARTAAGQLLVAQAEADGYLSATDFDLARLAAMQPFQKSRRCAVLPRLLAMQLVGRSLPRYAGFHLTSNTVSAGPLAFFREFAGMARRIVQGRACDRTN